MKFSFITFMAIIAALSAVAQPQRHKQHSPHSTQARQLLSRIMTKQAAHTAPAARTTATSQRIVAQAQYSEPFTDITDSFSFRYNSSSRGSAFLPEYMTFTPQYVGSSFDHFYDVFGYDANYGTPLLHNEDLLVKSDTTYMYSTLWSSGSPVFGLMATEIHQFDAAGNLLDNTFIGDTSYYSVRDSMTYNSDGNIATVYQYRWVDWASPAYWQIEYASHFSYDASGRMVADSQSIYTGGWIPQWKYTYDYDASGNMVLAQKWDWDFPGYILTGSYVMSYDASDRLVRYKYYNHDAATAELEIDDSIAYTPGVSYHTYFHVKEYYEGALLWLDILTKNTSANGKPDTMRYTSYDEDSATVLGSALAAYVYNSFANPERMTVYYDDNTTTPVTESERTFYYYETYDPAAVTDVHSYGAHGISLQPNPAGASVTAVMSGTMSPGSVTVHIADMTGHVLSVTDVVPVGNRVQLSVADLPAGCYLLSATQNGHVLGREKLIKQ